MDKYFERNFLGALFPLINIDQKLQLIVDFIKGHPNKKILILTSKANRANELPKKLKE